MKLQPRSGKALIDLVRRVGWPLDERGMIAIVRPPGSQPIQISSQGDRTSAARNLGQLRRAGLERALERVERQESRRRERNGQEHQRAIAQAAQAAQAETRRREELAAVNGALARMRAQREEQERLFGALSPREVADVLDLTPARVYQLLGAGQLVGTRVPNQRGRLEWCIAWDDVVTYDAARAG